MFIMVETGSNYTNSNQVEKRIHVGSRVSGSHGKLVANPNSQLRRRVKEKLWGIFLESVGGNRYIVRFVDSSIKECSSTTLRM
mmetsp:Transcript_31997/g.63385  ORF Transcript_31997/g.63385 Transcript_31997/m.63385 type:complete len:83 (+) Transcript_31997:31-279(+)